MTHVVVVGAYGSAGVVAAGELADAGYEVTMVDDGDPGGGLCILRGCMPSKEVISAGAHRFQARHDHRLADPPTVDLDAVVDTKNDHVADFAAHRRAAVHDLTDRENVTFLRDPARFVDDLTLDVGDRRLDPDYVVLATGSVPNVPDLPGIGEVNPMTSADVLDARTLPDTGVVMGFGYVGLELVPYLTEAGGMDLVVVEHDDRPIDEADPEFGDAAVDLYDSAFDVTILRNTYEEAIEATADGVRLHTDRDDEYATVEADRLFTFTGRRPNLDGLGVEHAALDPGPNWVESTMQARDNPRVFVVGDANGHEPILHVAKEQAAVAAANLLAHDRGGELDPYENVHHHVMFSGLGVYPFVRVGHNETTAREAGYDPVVTTRQASNDGVFRTKDVPEGLAKLVVARDGTVLGYQGMHYHADVMAKTMQVVIETGTDVRTVPDRSYHPTTSEILDSLFQRASEALADEG
jgi:dihydrolipoamide dehydrogenase